MFSGNLKVLKRTAFLAWMKLHAVNKQKGRGGGAVETCIAKFLGGAARGLKQVVFQRWGDVVKEMKMEKIKSGAAASLAEAERRAAEKEKELRQQNEDLLNRSKANVT